MCNRLVVGVSAQLLSGPIFTYPKTGLLSVVDNMIYNQQTDDYQPNSHNVLKLEDIGKLYVSVALSRESPRVVMTRLLLDISFQTVFRHGRWRKVFSGMLNMSYSTVRFHGF